MAVKHLGNEKDGLVEIGGAHAYKIGDLVFWATASTAGEGMFIGRLKASPDILVLIVRKTAVETAETECAPTGRGLPVDGASWRRTYLKERPGSLAAGPPRTRVVMNLSCNPWAR